MKKYKTPMFKPHKLKVSEIMAGSGPYNTTNDEVQGKNGGINNFYEDDVEVVFK